MNLITALGRDILFRFDPETAHGLSIKALKSGLVPAAPASDPRLAVRLAGLDFSNPVGLAAGYDKNAEVPDAILRLGFGFAEAGTITPRAQPGNPKPRIFRLAAQEAVINRLGFNNEGHAAALVRLKARAGRPGIVGVNIGANKDAADFAADYVAGIEAFWNVASYFTANISSPNTPGLRNLQAGEALQALLERVLGKRDELAARTKLARPVFLKIAPDLDRGQIEEIAGVVSASTLDGIIISNTTVGREGVEGSPHASEAGGLSGKPLFERSTIVLARMRQLLGPDLPIIGVGGIDSAQTAIAKLEAGANLVQLYTGMVYRGPGIACEIRKGLLEAVEARGLDSVSGLTGLLTAEWAARKLPGEA
ncbi:MAG: quinone-dependent dihydroorotate dehydrogenase [Nitratireductor sp.]|nr:quinone-dependent dihydroorotate dehydrogenase [Nitratireductor sp.]